MGGIIGYFEMNCDCIYFEPVKVYILELSSKCGFNCDLYFLIMPLYWMIPGSVLSFYNEVFSHGNHRQP